MHGLFQDVFSYRLQAINTAKLPIFAPQGNRMRSSFGFSHPSPNVTRFLIVIIGAYLLFALLGRTAFGFRLYNMLLLNPYETIWSFQIWRLFTYALLHDLGSPLHVIFNALVLYMIGTPLEDHWGEKRFLLFILTAILLGGVLVCLSFLLGLSDASVAGFSSVTIGLVVAWGLTFPTQQIYIFGILPLTGKNLVYMTVLLEVLYAVSSNSISSAAHFGGIIAGAIFALDLYKPRRLKQMWHKNKMKRNLRKM
jgi:membrane associated rhomboid family serine protease